MTGLATGLMSVVLALGLGWICVADLRTYRIPDTASLGLMAMGLIQSVVATGVIGRSGPLTGLEEALPGALLGYGVFALLGWLHHFRTGEDGLGLGDAKLLAAAGAWLGWRDLPGLVAMAALGALAFAFVARRRKIAFGPWLAGAFWILWVMRIA